MTPMTQKLYGKRKVQALEDRLLKKLLRKKVKESEKKRQKARELAKLRTKRWRLAHPDRVSAANRRAYRRRKGEIVPQPTKTEEQLALPLDFPPKM